MIMIEKIYKEACDEIHGDKKAILDKAFERAQKPVKRRNPVLKYSVIGTAAAAVLIAGAIFINIDLFKITEPKNFEDDAVISESASDVKESENVVDDEEETQVVYESETKPQSVNKAEESAAKTENKKAAENSVKKDAKKEASGAVKDMREENAKKDVPSEMAENGAVNDSGEVKKAEKSMKRSISGTEPESNQVYMMTADSDSYRADIYTEPQPEANGIEAYSDDDDDYNSEPTAGMYGSSNRAYDEKVMTYDEYKEYLGFDVTALVMPQGTAPIEAPDKCVLTVDDSGEIVDDIVVFENKDEAKPVVVTAGRLLDVSWALKDGNTEAIVFEESSVIYAKKDGASFIVECENMASEEVHAIEAQFKGER